MHNALPFPLRGIGSPKGDKYNLALPPIPQRGGAVH